MAENENLDNVVEKSETPQAQTQQRRTSAESRPSQDSRPRRRGRRRKEDYFQSTHTIPNYKDVDILKRFLTDRAKIRPRRQTGLSSKHQRLLARQIKRARHLALLPFTDDQART